MTRRGFRASGAAAPESMTAARSAAEEIPSNMRLSKKVPGAARKVVITGGKGGLGKTAIARDLAFSLALQGYATLLEEVEYNTRLLHTVADISSTGGPRIDTSGTIWTLFTRPELVRGMVPLRVDTSAALNHLQQLDLSERDQRRIVAERRWYTPQALDFIPGSPRLRELDNTVYHASASTAGNFDPLRQFAFGQAELQDRYDVIIMDTPPVTGMVQRNALAGADAIILVVGFDVDSIEDVTRDREFIADAIAMLRMRNHPTPRVLGVVYNKYDESFEVDRDLYHRYRHEHRSLPTASTGRAQINPPLIPFPELGCLCLDYRTPKLADLARLPIQLVAPESELARNYGMFVDAVTRALQIDRFVTGTSMN